MSEKRRVLVVDNDADMREMLAFRLEIAGYLVFTAGSAPEAHALLANEVIHLAVVDVRLHDDSRPGDQSGFDLVQAIPDYIPYVAFTAYEDLANLKRANLIGARTLSKATDDAIPRLLELLDELFRTRAQVNLDLLIQPPAGLSFADLAAQIQLPGPADSSPPCADDLLRILQTLFYDAAELEVALLLPPEKAPSFSQSGSLLLSARARYLKLGRAEPVVIKISSAEEVRREAANHAQIEQFLHGKRSANLRDEAYSRRLGGLLYSFIDDDRLETIRVFDEVYHRYDARRVVALLDQLFGQMLGPLFKNAGREELDLARIYGEALRLTPEKLTAALTCLRPEDAAAPTLCLPGLDEPLPNPLVWLCEAGGFRPFSASVPVCLCHGDLHGRNILVDSNDRFWLIDFARVGMSHALRDFVELETDIKFHLLREPDQRRLLAFEQRLLSPTSFGEPLPAPAPSSAQLRKASQVIGALRQLAAQQLKLDGDMREYYLALLFHTVNLLRLGHIGADRKQYALLSAALICRRLEQWPAWEPPRRRYGPQLRSVAIEA